MRLFRTLLIALWALAFFSEAVRANNPFQVAGEVHIEISSDYDFSKRQDSADGGWIYDSETRRSKLTAIYKFPGQFGIGDYAVASLPMIGTASVSGSKKHETNAPGAGAGCSGTRDIWRSTETWDMQNIAIGDANTASLSYSQSDKGARIEFAFRALNSPAAMSEITRTEDVSDCDTPRPTMTSKRMSSNESDLGIDIATLIATSDQPKGSTFILSGERDLTPSELISAASPQVRDGARLRGRIKWTFTFSGLPVPAFDIKPLIVERGGSITLKAKQPPNEIRGANWIVEPEDDCFNAAPVPIAPAYAEVFLNPKEWAEGGGESIQRSVNALSDDSSSIRQQSWTMLCTLNISLELKAGGVFTLRSGPTRVIVKPRHFATAVKSLGPEAAAALTKPFENSLMGGMNIRPDCISREGELRSPFDQGTDTCPVAFDGFYPGKPISAVVQMASIPWQSGKPPPMLDANGSLTSGNIVPNLEAGSVDGPFPFHFWVAGHLLRQTNMVAMNPALKRGGLIYNFNQYHAALYQQYYDCVVKHEALHGDFYKEQLSRRSFSGEVDPDKEILDPAWLIEGMWDVSQDALERRVLSVLSSTSNTVGASNKEEPNGDSLGHAWIYEQMRKASAVPKCCSRTMELKTETQSQIVDFISGFPHSEKTSCK